jgi:hypothetical protein
MFEEQLQEIIEHILAQYDGYCFVIGKANLEAAGDMDDYMGYPVIYSPLVEKTEETVYFVPMTSHFINTNN